MNHKHLKPVTSILLILTTFFASLMSVTAQAAIITTDTAVSEQTLAYDRDQLRQLLDREGVREQLLQYGVRPDLVQERINSLTASELAEINTQLGNLPAGEGALGLVVLVFVVFIVTDMLCATDIFPFVKCIN